MNAAWKPRPARACGSGAVATGILLSVWDDVQPSSPIEILSSSGLIGCFG